MMKWYGYMQQIIIIGEKNNHFRRMKILLLYIIIGMHKALNRVIVNYEEEKKEYTRLNGLDE